MQLFDDEADYAAFERVIEETFSVQTMRICAYCIMPNHWHFVLWPQGDRDLAVFMQRLAVTHVTRWQKDRGRVGTGHIYQGRYKSFPVKTDQHFHQVVRYVERNSLRANLVDAADQWRWSSLWRRVHGTAKQKRLLSSWPVTMPSDWLAFVNEPQSEAELEALRRSVNRGSPYGDEYWVRLTAEALGLEHTMRVRGRPRRQ